MLKPVLIYQMGKVGSTAICESMMRRGYEHGVDCFHIHDLHKPTKLSEKAVVELPKGDVDIITMTRDAVARNISSFFQCVDMEERAGEWFVDCRQVVELMSAKELLHAFFTRPQWKHEEPLGWFDRQLKHFYDIDVYQTSFDVSKGYQTYSNGGVRCLLLRMEDLQKLEVVISDFIGIDCMLGRSNRAEDHWYKNLYRQFLESQSMPENYLDKMYSSKYMRHFYSSEEIATFRRKWKKPKITIM